MIKISKRKRMEFLIQEKGKVGKGGQEAGLC